MTITRLKSLYICVAGASWLCATAQTVQIDTLSWQNGDTDMLFPVFRTGNPAADSLINRTIFLNYAEDVSHDVATFKSLQQLAQNDYNNFSFEVTYNDHNILSCNISGEACRAYCAYWTDYFNFDIRTGRPIVITDVIDTAKVIGSIIEDRERQYQKALEPLLQDAAEDGQQFVEWATEAFESCHSDFSIETFTIYPDRLAIIDRCEFPHAIQNLTPNIELNYSFRTLGSACLLPPWKP